jgi:hypothetical protein
MFIWPRTVLAAQGNQDDRNIADLPPLKTDA